MAAQDLALMIPIVALSIPIIKIWTNHRFKVEEMRVRATAELSAEKAAQYASHTSELEDRVRVLERIVTDKGYDVATQIEALRDARKVEALMDSREEELRK
jgi:hypothetical protein